MLFLNNRGKITWSTNLHGRIMYAKKDFKYSDYHDLEIHDTHGRSTFHNIFFPEEFNYGKENTEKVLLQMEMILSKVAEIIKPHLKCFTESNNCFEVFGIDFMIKNDFTVILIEINDGYGIPNDNKNEYDTEQGKEIWNIYIKEFVKWIYDNGIAAVYDTKTLNLLESSKNINYDNHFEENKENLHLIYKYYQTTFNSRIKFNKKIY
jgi:hypothetical protein